MNVEIGDYEMKMNVEIGDYDGEAIVGLVPCAIMIGQLGQGVTNWESITLNGESRRNEDICGFRCYRNFQ